jgi:hypothetical protein
VKGKPKWKIKPKRFDIFESANIVNNSVKNNAKALETTVQSSAKSLTLEFTASGRSLM